MATYNKIAGLLSSTLVLILCDIVPCQVTCKPRDCYDLKCYRLSKQLDGPHTIYPSNANLTSVDVTCDQRPGGGGWIVFQRRVNGRVNFTGKWEAFKNGFGQVGGAESEFWLGNEIVHRLTEGYRRLGGMDCQMQVEGYAYDGSSCFIRANKFRLGNETDDYRIYLTNIRFASNARRSDLSYHNGRPFSTYDKHTSHCVATHLNGAWWFHGCARIYLNGPRMPEGTETFTSMYIQSFKGYSVLSGSQMMFRPAAYPGCVNPCENGGTCEYLAESDSRHCICPDTHCGPMCDMDNPCANNGSCEFDVDSLSIMCACASTHCGIRCEHNNTCQNDGRCVNDADLGGVSCVCQPGYCGDECQITNPCENGGSCVVDEDTGVTTCICTMHHTGSNCDDTGPDSSTLRTTTGSGSFSSFTYIASIVGVLIVTVVVVVCSVYCRKHLS